MKRKLLILISCLLTLSNSLYAQQSYKSKQYGYIFAMPDGWTFSKNDKPIHATELLRHFENNDTSYKAAPPPLPKPSQEYLDWLAQMDLFTFTKTTTNYITVNVRTSPFKDDIVQSKKDVHKFLIERYKELDTFGDYNFNIKISSSTIQIDGRDFDKIHVVIVQDKKETLYVDHYTWFNNTYMIGIAVVYDDMKNEPIMQNAFIQAVNSMK